MGNSLLLNRHIDDDAATATNIYALEQREQKDLAIQLSSSNLFSETLKLKKTLETVSSTRSISDEMHLPLSEKYNRHINIAGFWKNIIAQRNRRKLMEEGTRGKKQTAAIFTQGSPWLEG